MTGAGRDHGPVRLPKSHMSQEEFDDLGYPSIPSHWTKEWMLQQLELEKYKITEIALSTSLRLAQQQRTSLNQLLEGRPDEVEKLRSLRTRLDEGGRDEAARLLDEFTARAKDRLLDYKQAERSEPMVLDTDTMAKLMTRAQKLRKDPMATSRGTKVLWRKLLKAGNKMVKELHVILLKNVAQAAIKLGHWTDALRAADDCLAIDDQEIWVGSWFRRACALEGLGRYAEEEEALAQVESIAVGRADAERLQKDDEIACRGSWTTSSDEELEDTEERLEDLEQELKELEAEEAALEEATAEECPFSVGDCVVLRAAFAEWPAGHRGTVAAVDGDGDMKVLFDGETEAQLILSIDFDLFTSVGSESAERVEPEPPALEKVLTVEGAQELVQDLLEALASSYEDSGFQQQVAKLCRDTRWRKEDFMRHLPKVALERQKSILPSFGFEASVQGAQEAEKAIAQAKERAKEAKRAELQQRADAVTRSLFGEMYEIIFAHFPTASEAFQVVAKAAQAGSIKDYEVFVEYADGPDRSQPNAQRKLSSLRQEKVEKSKRGYQPQSGYQPSFRPPCGWQRIWRISHQQDVLWDRSAKLCLLPLSRSPSAVSAATRNHFAELPAAILARVVLICDLSALMTLASAFPAIGRTSLELAEAMPVAAPPAGAAHARWLSFARASLRWAELLGGLRSAVEASRGSVGRRKSSSNDSSHNSLTMAGMAGMAADALDSESPALSGTPLRAPRKMGLLKTKSPVISLDLGKSGEMLAAITMNQAQSVAMLWDLTSVNGASSPLWQVSAAPLDPHFLSDGLLVGKAAEAARATLQVLDYNCGRVLQELEFPGVPSASCKCMPMPTASPSRRTTMLPSVFVAAAGNIYKVVDDAVDPVQRRVVPFATLPSAVLALAAAPRCSAGAAVAAVAAARADGLVSVLSTDEVLVCAVNLGTAGTDSAACALTAWHLPSCTPLPHPWHLAGPLEASPSTRSVATAPVLLPGTARGAQRRSVEALRHCHVTNPGGHPAWFPDPPRVVLVLGGTNDLRSVPLEVTVANLKAMHELAAQTSLVGVLALPKFLNPQVGSHQKRESLNLRLAELVESYSEFHGGGPCPEPTRGGATVAAGCGWRELMSAPDQLQDEVWQDREIKFDQMPQLLKLRKGEFQIDSINSDTKGNNGERGILIVTNLRLIWTSAKYARTNLRSLAEQWDGQPVGVRGFGALPGIGFNCVSSVNIRSVTSKLRGNSQALYVMTRFNSTRFEFIFTSLVKHSPRLFTTVQAVFKSYETTKLYRDLKLRGAIIRDKEWVD
eukprot:g2730.t2